MTTHNFTVAPFEGDGYTVEPHAFDMIAYLTRQRAFSEKTFGPGTRTQGVIDHIVRELGEVYDAPTDLKEWIDVVTLALDGAWRAGHSPQAIVAQLEATLTRNEGRTWPDWRTADPTKAIEHDRSKDKPTNMSGTDLLPMDEVRQRVFDINDTRPIWEQGLPPSIDPTGVLREDGT